MVIYREHLITKPQTFYRAQEDSLVVLKVQKKMKEAEHDTFLPVWQWDAIASPLLLVIAAWGIIFIASAQHQIVWLDHDFLLQKSHFPWIITLIIFLVCWQVMILAMMLPSVLPLLFLLGDRTPAYSQRWRQQGLFIIGYAMVWTIFALAAFMGDTALHWLVARWWWLYLHPWVIGTLLLACAGIFQLSLFKQRCLRQCCFPFDGYLSSIGQEKRSLYGEGVRYGTYCLGSCWALMLVQFGLGMSSLIWMALGTGIVMGEKVIAGRLRFSQMVAGVFLLLALLWAVLPFGSLSHL
jgi:predicted metal-binding membrane protein